MSTFLPLILDGPMQAWGHGSRFQRRTTGLYPTKSGVVGMLAAAMGLAKGSAIEATLLPQLAALGMTVFMLPREHMNRWSGKRKPLDIRRLDDFHTVGGGYDKRTHAQLIPRKASGGPCDNAVLTHRQYLLDARFGVLLEGERMLLDHVAAALRDPVWGVWLGRKSCIPATPLLPDPRKGAVFTERQDAFATLVAAHFRLNRRPLPTLTPTETDFNRVVENGSAADSIADVPVSFGDGGSSGPDKRVFAVRRVTVLPGRSDDSPASEDAIRHPTI